MKFLKWLFVILIVFSIGRCVFEELYGYLHYEEYKEDILRKFPVEEYHIDNIFR